MPTKKPSLIIVDTNCFVRLMFSPLRPVLGHPIAGYELKTLTPLAKECGPETDLVDRHPWLLDPKVQDELLNNCLNLRQPKARRVEEMYEIFRKTANSVLRKHCLAEKLTVIRELSRADLNALATAQVLAASLATDEWPLTLAASRVSDIKDILTSVRLTYLIESDGKITREQRIKTIGDWVKNDEKLPVNWRSEYRELFREQPPDGQS